MSVTVNYKGSELTTVANGATKTLTTSGAWMEDDVEIVDTTVSGSATTPATTITANPSISVNASGLITATNSKTQNVTPTVNAGYVSAGTAGTITVSGSNTQQLTTKAAATITPGTTNQTIASGTYLTGTQTIAGDADLVASNIISTANIFGVQGSVVVQGYYTGTTAPSSSLGSNGDLYLQTAS